MIILDILCLKLLGHTPFHILPNSKTKFYPKFATKGDKLTITENDYKKKYLSLSNLPVGDLVMLYQQCNYQSYNCNTESLPNIMALGSRSLRENGRLFYLGVGSAGALGCIDASGINTVRYSTACTSCTMC